MSLDKVLGAFNNFSFDRRPLKEAIELIYNNQLKELVQLNYDCLAEWNKEKEVSSFYEIIQVTSNDYCRPLIAFLKEMDKETQLLTV